MSSSSHHQYNHHLIQCHIYRSSNSQGELPSPTDPVAVRLIRLTKPLTDTPETILKCLGETVLLNSSSFSSSSTIKNTNGGDTFLQPIAEYLDQANLHYITFMSTNTSSFSSSSPTSNGIGGGGGVNAALKNKLKNVNDILNREGGANKLSSLSNNQQQPSSRLMNQPPPSANEQLLHVLSSQGKKNLVTVNVYPAFSDGSVDLSSVSDSTYEGPLKLKEPLLEQLETRSGIPMVPGSTIAVMNVSSVAGAATTTSSALRQPSSSSVSVSSQHQHQHQHQHSPTRTLKIASMVIHLAIVMVVDSLVQSSGDNDAAATKRSKNESTLKLTLTNTSSSTAGASPNRKGSSSAIKMNAHQIEASLSSSSLLSSSMNLAHKQSSSSSAPLLDSRNKPTPSLRIGRANSVLRVIGEEGTHTHSNVSVSDHQQQQQQRRQSSVQSVPRRIQTSHLVDGVDPLKFASNDDDTEVGGSSSSLTSPTRRLQLPPSSSSTSDKHSHRHPTFPEIKPVTSFSGMMEHGQQDQFDTEEYDHDDDEQDQSEDNENNEEETDYYNTPSSTSTQKPKRTTTTRMMMSPGRIRRLEHQRQENIARIERKREEEERKKREQAALYERERQEKRRLEKDIKHQATLAQKRQQLREAEIERKKASYATREQDLAYEKNEFSRRLEVYKTIAQIESLKVHQPQQQQQQHQLLGTKISSSTATASAGNYFSSTQIGEENRENDAFRGKRMSEMVERDLEGLVKRSVDESSAGDRNMAQLEVERDTRLKEIQNRRGLSTLLHDLGERKAESSKVKRKQIIDYQEVMKMLKR